MSVPAADNLRQMAANNADLWRTNTTDAVLDAADMLDALDALVSSYSATLDAIDALHQPERVEHYEYESDHGTVREVVVWCTCGQTDCPTCRILHPEETA